jgi:magnesium chelatase family protein
MQSNVQTVRFLGVTPIPTTISVSVAKGNGGFRILGVRECAEREIRVRCRSALGTVPVDLGEWDIQVEIPEPTVTSAGLDLPIVLGILAAIDRIPPVDSSVLAVGEISLTGQVRSCRGVVAALCFARAHGYRTAIVPAANAVEASAVEGLETIAADSLAAVVEHLKGESRLLPVTPSSPFQPGADYGIDLADVRGMVGARRGLEIAAAGAHPMLFVGPAGAGKTMLARRLPGILPLLSKEEALEISTIHSVAGLLPPDRGIVQARPFRAPHHTVSAAGLVGGGDPVRPGEVSLATGGVLFLDELLEFRRNVLEALRQPFEEGLVTVCRGQKRTLFPARPLLVAGMNACPCGKCDASSATCSPDRIEAFQNRLAGPIADHLQIVTHLPRVDFGDLCNEPPGESSATVRARVNAARLRQAARFADGETSKRTNGELAPRDLERVVGGAMDRAAKRVLAQATERLELSAPAYGKLLKIIRTLADLDDMDVIRNVHVSEALTWSFKGKLRSSGAAATKNAQGAELS